MDTADLVSKAAEYTEKFVQAALPVAKKAYEIGLLTLRIDGIQSIITSVLFLIIGGLGAYYARYSWKYATQYSNEHPGEEDNPLYVWSVVVYIAAAITLSTALYHLIDVWVWIKMIQPDLWLAHAAIQKALELSSK